MNILYSCTVFLSHLSAWMILIGVLISLPLMGTLVIYRVLDKVYDREYSTDPDTKIGRCVRLLLKLLTIAIVTTIAFIVLFFVSNIFVVLLRILL